MNKTPHRLTCCHVLLSGCPSGMHNNRGYHHDCSVINSSLPAFCFHVPARPAYFGVLQVLRAVVLAAVMF